MRCKEEGCMITTKQPNKNMCWREFGMCKTHAYQHHPEAYADTKWRPISSRLIYGAMQIKIND